MQTPRFRMSVAATSLLLIGGLWAGYGAQAIALSSQEELAEGSADWKAEWDKVLAAAKKEGAISVAGPAQAAERAVIAKFRDAYPDIKLHYTGLSSGSFLSRVTVERQGGNYEWDVMVGGPSSFFDFIKKGFFQPLAPLLILPDVADDRTWLGGVRDGFQDDDEKYVFAFTTYITNQIKVNRTVIPESQLDNVEQLLDPKWKGKIVFYDPRGGGAGSTALSMLYKELGADKIKTLLVDQQPLFSTDKRQFTEWIIRGEYPIGIGIVDAYLTPFLEHGIGKNVINLKSKIEVITTGSGTVVVMDRNPHPNASKVFVNWLLTQTVQTDWAKSAATNSRRLDVASGSPETRPDPAKLDNYLNFNRQSNNYLKAEAQALARKLRP
jgi:iron(III) transport system substrate-binding protein